MRLLHLLISIIFINYLSQIKFIGCSNGDRLDYYVDCMHYCFFKNCSSEADLIGFKTRQDNLLKLLGWSCEG